MEEKRTSGPVIVAIVVIFLIAAPLLYVLSVGPADAYFQNGNTPDAVVAFYSPLAWVAANSPTCKEWLLWYINLWK